MTVGSTIRPYRPPRRAAGEERFVRISDDHLKSVVFICIDGVDDAGVRVHTPGGTGFMVAVDASPGRAIIYVTTARHVIEEAGRDPVYIRVNKETGGYYDIPTMRTYWYTSDTADVAAIRLDLETVIREGLVLRALPVSCFVDVDFRYRGPPLNVEHTVQKSAFEFAPSDGGTGVPVGIGDEVWFVGLFVQHAGRSTNLPIARFGTLAAMPTEPVRMKRYGGSTTFDAFAYLVECHSWGGHSGSPAFWSVGAYVPQVIDGFGPVAVQTKISAFLGLVSGHFGIRQRATTTGDILMEGEGSIETELNAGIAIVTPASEITALLMREDLVNERDQLIKREVEQPTATPDSWPTGTDEFTRDDFMRDLTKVTRPVEESDQASS